MEITEFEEHSTDNDVVEFLKRTKLSPRKSYDEHTMIICLVNRKKEEINRKYINEELKKINPKYTIYILGRPYNGEPGLFIIFTPYPLLTKPIQYNLAETSKKYYLPSPIKFHLGIEQKISFEKTHLETFNIHKVFGLDEDKLKKKYHIGS